MVDFMEKVHFLLFFPSCRRGLQGKGGLYNNLVRVLASLPVINGVLHKIAKRQLVTFHTTFPRLTRTLPIINHDLSLVSVNGILIL